MHRGIRVSLAIFALFSVAAAAAEEIAVLRIMSFNVWYGGEEVSLEVVGEAIRVSGADVAGLQETDRNLGRIAKAAGMPYVDPRRRIISRYPLFDSGTGIRTEGGPSPYSTTGLDRNALHAWVMLRPGKVVAVANVHLSNAPSGLAAARAGEGPDDVMAIEQGSRVRESRPLTGLVRVASNGTPVFLTGDFNTASHLDWTGAARDSRSDMPYAFEWPVTRLLEDAGLRDSYREVHPDPVIAPGYTWTPGAPHPLADHERSRDRIDYIWVAGAARTVASQVVGEIGNAAVDIAVSPWPSDHRAVVSTFEVTPADAPPLISATPRRIDAGGVVLLRTWDPVGPAWTAVIVPRGGSTPDALTGVRDMPHDYQRSFPLSVHGLTPGDYDAILVGEGGEVLARDAFTVANPAAVPAVEAVDVEVRTGQPIRIRWYDAPGDLRDWVGLYRAGEVEATRYLAFVYTEALFDGEATVPVDTTDPIEPGEYELRLMHDETYVVLATAHVTVLP